MPILPHPQLAAGPTPVSPLDSKKTLSVQPAPPPPPHASQASRPGAIRLEFLIPPGRKRFPPTSCSWLIGRPSRSCSRLIRRDGGSRLDSLPPHH